MFSFARKGSALLVMAGLGVAQSQRPEFEVASVKAVASSQGIMMASPERSGDRVTMTHTTLEFLIQHAYRMLPYQISAKPALPDGLYDIEAKAAAEASDDQVRFMLQRLLEDRFQLKVHRETREMRIYALTPAKGGPKLKEQALPMLPNGRPIPAGVLRNFGDRTTAKLAGHDVPLSSLTGFLSRILDAPILDQTGLPGKFDLQLTFAMDSVRPQSGGDAAPAGAPSIFVAIQQELRLKLDSTKGPVEMLVIDHVEKVPSGN